MLLACYSVRIKHVCTLLYNEGTGFPLSYMYIFRHMNSFTRMTADVVYYFYE